MKGLHYLRMNLMAYQGRSDCVNENHKGDRTHIASKRSASVIVDIENEAVIGIADIGTLADIVQVVVMEMAFSGCVIDIVGEFIWSIFKDTYLEY